MIDDTLMREVAATVALHGPDAALDALRGRWPALRFTVCSDDDVPARLPPSVEGEGFNLYLIGSGDHCLTLTREPEGAVGIVVAIVDA